MCSLTNLYYYELDLTGRYKRWRNALRDAAARLCNRGNNNPNNGKFISFTAGAYNEIIFPRNRATKPRANIFYILNMQRTVALQSESGSYALLQRHTTGNVKTSACHSRGVKKCKSHTKSRSVKYRAKRCHRCISSAAAGGICTAQRVAL